MIFRCRVERVQSSFALDGPWTTPTASGHPSFSLERIPPFKLVYADDESAIFLMGGSWIYCWEVQTGKLRWSNRLRSRLDFSEERLWIDLDASSLVHFVAMTGRVEKFALDNGVKLSSGWESVTAGAAMSAGCFLPSRRTVDKVPDKRIQSHQIRSGVLAGCTRYFVFGETFSNACFDPKGRLVDYDEKAADTWLCYLGNGYPQPVEAAWLELDEMGRSLGPKKMRD